MESPLNLDDNSSSEDCSSPEQFERIQIRNKAMFRKGKDNDDPTALADLEKEKGNIMSTTHTTTLLDDTRQSKASTQYHGATNQCTLQKQTCETSRVQSLLPLAFSTKPTTKFRRRHERFNTQLKKAVISRKVEELTLLQQQNKEKASLLSNIWRNTEHSNDVEQCDRSGRT
jgi:hypothetical protein